MLRTVTLAGLSLILAAQALDARPCPGGGRWEELGCRMVGFITDRDTIPVGKREGRYKAIRLEVAKNDVNMQDLKVVYGNGATDDIPVRQVIRAGGQTRVIDLKGEARTIREINMKYRSKPSFKGQARVCVYGKQA